MSAVDDLITWLRAALDDDERVAHAVFGVNVRADLINGKPAPRWEFPPESSSIYSSDGILRVRHTWKREAEHIIRWDPARVLAEVEAKRRLVDFLGRIPEMSYDVAEWGLMLLAQPYAGRDGWREEWACPA